MASELAGKFVFDVKEASVAAAKLALVVDDV
jgi:hypothetical protein